MTPQYQPTGHSDDEITATKMSDACLVNCEVIKIFTCHPVVKLNQDRNFLYCFNAPVISTRKPQRFVHFHETFISSCPGGDSSAL